MEFNSGGDIIHIPRLLHDTSETMIGVQTMIIMRTSRKNYDDRKIRVTRKDGTIKSSSHDTSFFENVSVVTGQ